MKDLKISTPNKDEKKEWIEPELFVLTVEATSGGGVDAGFGGTLPT